MSVSRNVTAIVLNYESSEETKGLLLDLQDQPLKAIVVDNSSNVALSRWCEERGIEYANTGENLGYAGGNNVGIEAASHQTDYFLILNPDTTIIDESCVKNMVDTMERHPELGLVSPTVVSESGQELYGLSSRFTRILREFSLVPPLPRYDDATVRPADFLPGSAMMIRAEVFNEVGLLDDRFFLYFEEIEFCFRVRQHGYKVAVISDARIVHDDPEGSLLLDRPYQVYYNTRNRFLFANLRFDGVARGVVMMLSLALALISASRVVKNGRAALVYPQALGVLDGLLGRHGRRRYPINE